MKAFSGLKDFGRRPTNTLEEYRVHDASVVDDNVSEFDELSSQLPFLIVGEHYDAKPVLEVRLDTGYAFVRQPIDPPFY